MMKKVILLLILQLTVLMAADFTMSKSGTLTKEGATTPAVTEPVAPVATEPVAPVATEPVTTVPASQPGILPNSVDLIWEDQYGPNTGWTCQTSSGYPQFLGGVVRDFPNMGVSRVNAWYEVEEAGNGSSCSLSINQATNTRVEVGTLRGWVLYTDGTWYQYANTVQQTGIKMPAASDPFASNDYRGCGANPLFLNTRNANLYYNPVNSIITPDGFKSYKPNYYWGWHAWTSNIFTFPRPVKAVYTEVYMRLVVENPALPDDRDVAHYVAHISSDTKNEVGYTLGDIGISRYKKITNDWQPFNFLTGGITKEELQANPPPFSTVP